MQILSWNIQSGRGCDGITDIYRIIDFIRQQNRVDIICLQEVARYMPEYCPDSQADQLAIIAGAFPGFSAVWGTGMQWHQPDLPPREFGNLTLVGSTVLDRRIHCLPMPAGDNLPQMPRVATEATISTSLGPLRLFNTHIAYHNPAERLMQIQYLCRLQRWAHENNLRPPENRTGGYANHHRTAQSILCGDLNFTPASEEYRIMSGSDFSDAWQGCRPGQEHEPTCGVHDHQTWPGGAHCRDYFWISPPIHAHLGRFRVDQDTHFSDHQPILLSLDIDPSDPHKGD